MPISFQAGVRDNVGWDNLTLTYPASPDSNICAIAIVVVEGGTLAAPVYRGRTMSTEFTFAGSNNHDIGFYYLTAAELALGSGNTATCGASGSFGQWCIALFNGVDQSSLGSLNTASGNFGAGTWAGYTSALASGEWAVIGTGRQASGNGANSGWDADIGSTGGDDVSMLAAYESSNSVTVTYSTDPWNAGSYAVIELQEATGAQTLNAPHYSNSNSLFTPTLTHVLDAPHYSNTNSLFTPSLEHVLDAPHYSNTNSLFTPTLVPGPVALPAPHYANSNSLFTPTLVPGPVSLPAPHYANSNSLFTPTMAHTINAPHYANSNSLFTPTVSPGSVSVAPSHYANSNSLFTPTLVLGDQNLSAPHYANSNTLFQHGISHAGTQVVMPSHYANSNSLFTPTMVLAGVPMVTRTLYDFVTDRAGNAQTPPEGFLIKGMNSKLYNNSMREYVAKKARFRDDSTAIVASYVTGPDAVGSDVSLTLAQAGGFMDPPPVGLLLGFRVSSLNSNPLWLTIDGTNFYPVKGARGTNLLPSSLQPDSLYLCVFNGMEWQLLGNQKGTRRSGQAIRTRTDAVTLDLQATDLENTVAFVDSGAAGGSVTLVISDEMLTRWPIGGCIEFLNINYKSEVGISVDQSIVVPTSWDGGDGSRKLPLTTQSNEFVHFKLLRTTALELRPILNPRFVR